MSFGDGDLHVHVVDLQRENAELRDEIRQREESVMDVIDRLHGEKWALEAENAKLRELARDMYRCIAVMHISCDQCDIRPCRFKERLRELGIEVD